MSRGQLGDLPLPQMIRCRCYGSHPSLAVIWRSGVNGSLISLCYHLAGARERFGCGYAARGAMQGRGVEACTQANLECRMPNAPTPIGEQPTSAENRS